MNRQSTGQQPTQPLQGHSPARTLGSRSGAEVVLIAIPPALLLPCIIWFFWDVSVPFWDQFSMAFIFDKFYLSQLSIADFWEPYNGHRIPLQRAISLALGVLTGWHVGIEAVLPNILNVAIFVCILRELSRTSNRIGAAASTTTLLFLSVMFFSMNQYRNWFNGWDTQILLGELCSVYALLILCRETPRLTSLVGAVALTILSSFSFGAGLATWPVGCIAIWLNPPDRLKFQALALWIAAGATTGAFYLSGSQAATDRAVADPLTIIMYAAAYLGAPIFSINGSNADFIGPILKSVIGLVAPLVGLTGVVLAIFCYLQARRLGLPRRVSNFPLMLCLWALVSAGLTAITRSSFGLVQAMSPHYISVSRLLWIGLLMLYVAARPAILRHVAPRTVHVIGGLIAVLSLASYANGARQLRAWHRDQLVAQSQLLTRYDDATLRMLCPVYSLAELQQGVEALKRHQLALYAGVTIDETVGVYVPTSSPELQPDDSLDDR